MNQNYSSLALIIILLSCLIISLSYCMTNRNNFNEETPPLFLRSDIQDSLEAFLAELDSFPSRYKAPTVTNIDFGVTNSDTIICFSTCSRERLDPPNIKYNKVNVVLYNQRPIIVKYYDRIWDMSKYLDESLLSEDVYSHFRQALDSLVVYEDGALFHSYQKVYVLTPEGLKLIRVGYPAIGRKRILLKGERANKETVYYDPNDTTYY